MPTDAIALFLSVTAAAVLFVLLGRLLGTLLKITLVALFFSAVFVYLRGTPNLPNFQNYRHQFCHQVPVSVSKYFCR
jgi:hypothetical protein